jgi:hypothetical protein
VRPVEDDTDQPKVQMVTYSVVAEDHVRAMERFFQEEAGEIVICGDPIDAIVVGFEEKSSDLIL